MQLFIHQPFITCDYRDKRFLREIIQCALFINTHTRRIVVVMHTHLPLDSHVMHDTWRIGQPVSRMRCLHYFPLVFSARVEWKRGKSPFSMTTARRRFRDKRLIKITVFPPLSMISPSFFQFHWRSFHKVLCAFSHSPDNLFNVSSFICDTFRRLLRINSENKVSYL